MCAMCTTPPVSSASAMSRSAMIDSASPGMPRSPSAEAWKPLVRDAVALQRLLLAVLDHRHVEHARVLERAPHQQRRRHRTPVVGHRDAARLLAARRCRRAARPSGRARRRRSDTRAPGSPRPPSSGCSSVTPALSFTGIGVRHAGDGREPARDGRGRAGRHRLLVLLARLAQVHVHVDQARAHDEAARNLDHAHVRLRPADRARPARSDRRRSARRTRRRGRWPDRRRARLSAAAS